MSTYPELNKTAIVVDEPSREIVRPPVLKKTVVSVDGYSKITHRPLLKKTVISVDEPSRETYKFPQLLCLSITYRDVIKKGILFASHNPSLLRDGLIAATDRGCAVNLNSGNAYNLFYEEI